MRISDWSSDVCSSDLHLTHQENYRNMDGLLGLGDALVATPQRAAEPEIATQVLVIGMREGKFTPRHTLDRYINDRQTDYNGARAIIRSEEHTSELQSLMRISYAVFCLKKKNKHKTIN